MPPMRNAQYDLDLINCWLKCCHFKVDDELKLTDLRSLIFNSHYPPRSSHPANCYGSKAQVIADGKVCKMFF